MSYFGSKEFYLEVSKGNVPKHTAIIINGKNPDIDTGTEDIWYGGGTLTYLTTARTHNIVSTSTNDTNSSGTGARKVRIDGINSSGAAISETVNMNGTTNVLTSNSFLRINTITVTEAGAGLTNAGDISATATTDVYLQASMQAGRSVTSKAHYTVPTGKYLVIVHVELNCCKTTGGTAPLVEFIGKARVYSTSTNPWQVVFNRIMDTSVEQSMSLMQFVGEKRAAQTDLNLQVTTDQNNTQVSVRIYGILVDL